MGYLVCLLVVPCPALPAPQDTDNEEASKQVAPNPADGLGDILKFGGGLLQGLMSLLSDKVNFLLRLLGNKELQQTVGDTVGTGVNLSGQVARAAVPAVSGIIGAGSQGTRLLGSVIKAANDTAPLILQGINEFSDQLPLIAGFASAYAEVNAEQTQKVVNTFRCSLSRDLECEDLADSQAKAECEGNFCAQVEQDEDDFSV